MTTASILQKYPLLSHYLKRYLVISIEKIKFKNITTYKIIILLMVLSSITKYILTLIDYHLLITINLMSHSQIISLRVWQVRKSNQLQMPTTLCDEVCQ